MTILSGDIGVEADSTDNSYHVATGSATDSTAVLDGFTVTNGRADGGGDDGLGGGLISVGGSPTVTNATFSRNSAFSAGGGLYAYFENGPTLSNVTFQSNSARFGGGICAWANMELTNVVFSGNSAGSDGGGGLWNNSSAKLINVLFSDNTTTYWGGGMLTWNGYATLVNVAFVGNSADGNGGGLANPSMFGSPLFVNVEFCGNRAGQFGGGMYNFIATGTRLVNTTFSRNSAGSLGGGIFNDAYSNPTLSNAILWGDSAGATANEISNVEGSTPIISYSLIEGCGGSGGGWNSAVGTDGGNNIDADPLFVDGLGGNLRLSSGYSPAVNAGSNAALPPSVTTDLDGNPRIGGDTVDLGAYEFQVLTGVKSVNWPQPFRIVSVSPNPFNPSATVRFTLPAALPVTAEVWSVTGARVRVLVNKQAFGPGDNQLIWDGRNDHGSPVASGVYFIRVETRLGAKVARAVLLK